MSRAIEQSSQDRTPLTPLQKLRQNLEDWEKKQAKSNDRKTPAVLLCTGIPTTVVASGRVCYSQTSRRPRMAAL